MFVRTKIVSCLRNHISILTSKAIISVSGFYPMKKYTKSELLLRDLKLYEELTQEKFSDMIHVTKASWSYLGEEGKSHLLLSFLNRVFQIGYPRKGISFF